MSKQAATLLVGLLALAEGRSDDRNMLREADREDVLREVDPEMLDRIAHRLYAEDEEHLSAYERLLKDDKRKKIDYLNNKRSEPTDAHYEDERLSDDHVQHLKHKEEEKKIQEELIQKQKDREYQRFEDERREQEEIEKRIKD